MGCFMKKDTNDKPKNRIIDLSTILGFIGTVFGGLTTIWAAVKTEANGFITLYIVSLAMESVVFILWTLNVIEHFRHKKAEESLINKNAELEENCKLLNNEIESINKEHSIEIDKVISHLSDISLSIKNNSIHNNEWLVKVPSQGDASYQYSSIVSNNNNISPEDKFHLLVEDAKRYSLNLFDLYKKYCSDMLEEVKRLETAYIKIKGYDVKIAVSLKLFDKPYVYNVDRRTDIHVYTAFRDKDTYNDKDEQGLPKREIGQILYSIDLNDDFTACLTKEVFYVNNVTRQTVNYRNEHSDFDNFYNSSIVVPIRINMSNGNRKFFGYLCCDCMNHNTTYKVFDKGAAQYLFAFAQNFATFIETIDSNWLDRFSDNALKEIPKTAIQFIYEKTYRDPKMNC